MELKDLIFTPIILIVIYGFAYRFRSLFTNEYTHRYFIPGLTVKLVGAISLGLVYQFYYDGGDTFNYFEQSKYIYESFFDSPLITLKLILSNGAFEPSTFLYSQHIYWYTSPTEYFVIKIAGLLGLLTFGTYSSIAVLFAALSFTGLWAAYVTFLKEFPKMATPIAIALFFLPSVFFWGSGLMKDTLAIGALGWLFYAVYHLFIIKKNPKISVVVFVIAFYTLYVLRVFVLLSFLPPAILWIFSQNSKRIRNPVIRKLGKPILLLIGLSIAYYVGINITEGDTKYDIEEIGKRTKINAEYLYRISQLEGGSGYYLGEMDGSVIGMAKLAPKALVVTLFRPFVWEIKNVMMLLSSIEASIFLFLSIRLFISPGLMSSIRIVLREPMLVFCIIYSITLAIAIGLNSYNFGSLVRYKIQILPFFLSSVLIIWGYRTKDDTLKIS